MISRPIRATRLIVLAVLVATGPVRAGAAPGDNPPAASATAAAEEKRVQARARLDEAEALYTQGDYVRALERLDEAYALVPSPRRLFNYGLVFQGLARNAEALEAFETFLAEVPEATGEQRSTAQQMIADLRDRVGSIEIASDRDGAEVFVDGRLRGRTPLRGPLRVDPGPHQVVVQKAGASPYLDRIEAVAGRSVRLTARLAEAATAAPGPTSLVLRPAAGPASAAVETASRPPVYRRWWFWTAAAAVAAAAVAGVALSTGGGTDFCRGLNGGCFPVGK